MTAVEQQALFDASRVAALHREVGTLIAAATFAVDQLAPYELSSEHARVARAHAVLKDAIEQVSS